MPFDVGRFEAAREAFRRRAGQQPSTAGIPGGAPVANQPSATNPLMTMANRRLEGEATQPTTPMAAGGIKQLGQSTPDEATMILRALIQRLRQLSPQPTGGINA